MTVKLLGELLVFGAIFGVISASNHHPILAFTKADRVTMDLGVFKMVNAGGLFLGTVLSGLTLQAGGPPFIGLVP